MPSDSTEHNSSGTPLKVCLVLKDRGWILEKFANRLVENLPHWNVEAHIAPQPSLSVGINHWMLYCDVERIKGSRNTLSVTHVDRPAKLHLLKERLKKSDMAICMSRMTVEELVARGIDRQKLCFITPAHDGLVRPRRIVLGITSRLRADAAKREDFLIEVARRMRLDAFHFEIIGAGWEGIIPLLESAGATVQCYPGTNDGAADYKLNLERVPNFDYYLYLGFDEGSMGFLDALAAGVPTIVTPQGFHLDVNSGIAHAFSDAAELGAILEEIARQRQERINSVANLSWNEYARQHALVWRAILAGESADVSRLLHEKTVYSTPLPEDPDAGALLKRIRFWTNTNLPALRDDFLMLWEWYMGKHPNQTAAFRFARSLKRPFPKQ